MAENQIFCHARPETVYAVLSDPRPYSYVVVGTRRIRSFEPTWPAVGSVFHHSLGVGVTLIRDHTESLEVVEGSRIAMRTYMRPVAVNDVIFDLVAEDDGTRVTLTETAVGGPVALPGMRAGADGLFWLRNGWVLRRLRTVAERREQLRGTVAEEPSDPGERQPDAG